MLYFLSEGESGDGKCALNLVRLGLIMKRTLTHGYVAIGNVI